MPKSPFKITVNKKVYSPDSRWDACSYLILRAKLSLFVMRNFNCLKGFHFNGYYWQSTKIINLETYDWEDGL